MHPNPFILSLERHFMRTVRACTCKAARGRWNSRAAPQSMDAAAVERRAAHEFNTWCTRDILVPSIFSQFISAASSLFNSKSSMASPDALRLSRLDRLISQLGEHQLSIRQQVRAVHSTMRSCPSRAVEHRKLALHLSVCAGHLGDRPGWQARKLGAQGGGGAAGAAAAAGAPAAAAAAGSPSSMGRTPLRLQAWNKLFAAAGLR